MDTGDQKIADATITPEEQEPSKTQHLRVRGRSNSPPLRKVLVYDCGQRTVQVHSEKHVGKLFPSTVHIPN